MNILVTYATKTGNTQKIADAIYESLTHEKTILPIGEVLDYSAYDVILVGYWVDKGGPCKEAENFLSQIEGKTVGIFATLGYWADSEHAHTSLLRGEELVKEKNKVLAKYICQGSIEPKLVEYFKTLPADNPHAPTPEKLKRYEIAKRHPSTVDCMAASELFGERVESLYV